MQQGLPTSQIIYIIVEIVNLGSWGGSVSGFLVDVVLSRICRISWDFRDGGRSVDGCLADPSASVERADMVGPNVWTPEWERQGASGRIL